MANLLIVEDDKKLNRGVAFALTKENHIIHSAYNLRSARIVFEIESIELILLDISLPDGTGIDFCKEVRRKSNVPIVFFTANDTEQDMIRGYDVGCDDYISKPFSIEVLKYKINAIIKRKKSKNQLFEYSDLKIDYDRMKVMKNEMEIALTPTEYKLLELLSKNKGTVLTKEVLLEKLWDNSGNFVDENTLSVNIRRLRKKIESHEKESKYIITVFGIGYTFGG